MLRLAAALAVALLPGAALAHASERMVVQTLPTGWYMAGAALAILVTAGAGVFSGRLPGFGARILCERRALVSRDVTSWISAFLLAALLAGGLFGSRDPLGNLLPLTIWITLWVGLTVASAAFGNLWRDLSPWYGPVRFLRRRIGRRGGVGLTRLGTWPAVAGYLGFAWFEIVSPAPADPRILALVAGGYALAVLACAVAEGEDWLDRGEFLTVYFALIARIAPFWADYSGARVRVMAGLPGAQVMRMGPLGPSAIAFVTAVLASVGFDGLHETFWWLQRIGLNPLDFPGRSAVVLPNSVGLFAFWGISALTILAAIRLGLPAGVSFRAAAGPMMLAILPIGAGYHIAHYLVALLTNGQYVVAALSDPFALGWNLLGLPPHWVSFGFLMTRAGVTSIWLVQFAVILLAHLLAVILGLKLAGRAGAAAQGLAAHLPMTVLMVGYTVFGLWLLSAPTAG